MAAEGDTSRLARAEDFVFQSLQAQLERRGEPEALLYLRHLVSAHVESVKSEGTRRRLRFKLYQRTSDYSVQLNAVTGELRGWYFAALREHAGNDVDPAEALAIATAAAEPPSDAVLEHSGYEEQGDEPVFVARWHHVVDGVRVERDYIHVLVNGGTGRAFMVQRHWHELNEEPSWR